MIQVYQQDIDKIVKELESLKEILIEDFLYDHCSLIIEKLEGYDGCYTTKKVYSDRDWERAKENANEVILEAMKKLNIINNN